MNTTPTFDHIALTVPNLDAQVERLHRDFGMEVRQRVEGFAVVADPTTGLTFELARSVDSDVHFRHLGFRTDDVDATHAMLLDADMQVVHPPHRREFARMYTSFLTQPGCLEVQLVKYD